MATNALQVSTLGRYAKDGAYAVDKARAVKLQFYAGRCEAEGLPYIPLAMDTFGGWHPQALQDLCRICVLTLLCLIDKLQIDHIPQSILKLMLQK